MQQAPINTYCVLGSLPQVLSLLRCKGRQIKPTVTLEKLLRERSGDVKHLENTIHTSSLIKSLSLLPRKCLLEEAGNTHVIPIRSLQNVVFNPKGDEMTLM